MFKKEKNRKTEKGLIKDNQAQSFNPNAIIQVSNLTHDFGLGMGVFNVSFSVKKGEVYGFLGPNGAGKSTTIRHIMGFYKPDSGFTSVNGMESFHNYYRILNDVGYLPGEPALPLSYTGKEFIQEMKLLKHLQNDEMLNYLLSYFQVDPNLPCKEMSMGMKRKMAIVVAFMSDPQVLILDEPTSGLDPLMQEKFISFVKDEKKKGKTILLSSHIFSEVDATCDRIGIIKDGKLVSEFKADDLKHNTLKTYLLVFKSQADLFSFEEGYLNDKIKKVKDDPLTNSLMISVDDSNINDLVKSLSRYQLIDFTEKKETLKDYFMSFYKENTVFSGVKND